MLDTSPGVESLTPAPDIPLVEIGQPVLDKLPVVEASVDDVSPGMESSPPSLAENGPPVPDKPLLVYSRQRRQAKKKSLDRGEPVTLCKDLERITTTVEHLLPRPVAKRRNCKAPAAAPRRSRRVAGFKPCSPGPITSEAQKRVIRCLGFATDNKVIDQKAQDDYSKLFEGRLTDSHLAALAAFFGWQVDCSEEFRSPEILAGL
ncbi:hypothetical protein BS78_05G077200 [Paspalum vaginatum]|nr:hypothetical protein BS78_05G077200 [Paspalum vaginatum]